MIFSVADATGKFPSEIWLMPAGDFFSLARAHAKAEEQRVKIQAALAGVRL